MIVLTDTFSIRADIACVLVVALSLAFIIQALNFRLNLRRTLVWLKKRPLLYFATTLIIAIWILFCTAVIGSVAPAAGIGAITVFATGFVNYLLRLYRHKPFSPPDLAMSMNLAQLARMISPVAAVVAIGSAGFAAMYFIFLLRLAPSSGWPAGVRMAAGLLSAVFLAGVFLLNREKNPLRRLFCLMGADFSGFKINAYGSYDRNGFLIAFMEQAAAPVMYMPEGYLREDIECISKKYNDMARECANAVKPYKKRPHVVFVMSEAFSDPTAFGTRWSEDPIPFIRTLMDGPSAWQTLCPGYGGGTAHCECEALTGISTALCGDASLYESCVSKRESFPSYVKLLKSEGYKTIALHPYNDTMYSRPAAYSALGFDEFITRNNMTHKDKGGRGSYISDASAYAEIADMLRRSEEPTFVHLVTMQNHGDYKSGRFDNRIKADGISGKAADALETYAQGLRNTDDATKKFFSELRTLEREVIVMFWGDHLPHVYPDAAVDNRLRQYLTPAFCWSTGEAPHISNTVRSPIFFARLISKSIGLPPRGFDMLLGRLGNCVHGIHPDFVIDNCGNVLYDEPDGEAGELLREYRMIQYDLLCGGNWAEKAGFYEKRQKLE